MMTLPELDALLSSAGIRLSLRLVVDAPRGVLTEEIKAALAAHKARLVSRLAAADAHGAGRPPLYIWEELSAWRWGGSTDPTPGIVIDRPDPVGRAERLARIFSEAGRDPYTAAERLAIQGEGEADHEWNPRPLPG
jgi:hypothetical protein